MISRRTHEGELTNEEEDIKPRGIFLKSNHLGWIYGLIIVIFVQIVIRYE